MKTMLLIGSSMLLFHSCIELSDPESVEVLSDEEMKAQVEVEEIDFEIGQELTDVGLKDSINSERPSHELIAPSVEKERVILKKPLPKLPPIPVDHGQQRFINPDFDASIDAQYPGGIQELKTFIADNLIYPDVLGCYEGRVYVSFIVEKDGCITHVAILRGISEKLDNEALRVVRAMPKWIPAQNNGKVVAARVRLPISFTLN